MVRSGLERRLPIFGQIIIRNDDDDGVRILGLDFSCEIQTVFTGQTKVRKDGVGRESLHSQQGFLAVLCFENVNRRQPGVKSLFEKLQEVGVVLNEEYTFHIRPG